MKKIFFKKVKKFILLRDIFYICNYSQNALTNQKIFGVNNIKEAINGDVTFFDNLKYEYDIKITKASACIVKKKLAKYLNVRNAFLVTNGGTAIQIAIRSLNLPKGSKILIQDHQLDLENHVLFLQRLEHY